MRRSKLVAYLRRKVTLADLDFLREDPETSYLYARHRRGRTFVKVTLLPFSKLKVELIQGDGQITGTHVIQISDI